MQHISKSASYVQNAAVLKAEDAKRSALSSLCERDSTTREIWDLLQTPQTVDTLSRRLDDENVDDITASLTRLIREDLIEISPDS
jgi:hypothetical protein